MPRRRQNGRPTLLEGAKQVILLQHLRDGNTLQVAARLAGVSPATVEEWRRRGEGRDDRPALPIYKQFAADLAWAAAAAEAAAVANIVRHMPRDYQAAKFWLQTRRPDAWGDKVADQLAPGGHSGPLITGSNVIVISPEQAKIIAGQQLEAERLSAGISADPTALDELAVGPDEDQR
jgi:transposase-like protein